MGTYSIIIFYHGSCYEVGNELNKLGIPIISYMQVCCTIDLVLLYSNIYVLKKATGESNKLTIPFNWPR